jgi:thymidine kinase
MEAEMSKNPLVRDGWIEVICGCMRSGKSREAYKRIEKEILSRERKVRVFTPDRGRRQMTITATQKQIDTKDKIVTRAGDMLDAIEFPWNNPSVILEHLAPEIDTILIEEAHFCTTELVEVCRTAAEKFHLRVIVAGLDQTFTGEGFGPMPALMVEAELLDKELAVCMECGSQNASKSWLDTRVRNQVENGDVLVGDEQYRAVCRHCYRELQQKYGNPT